MDPNRLPPAPEPSPDEVERLLLRQSLQAPPPEWRDDILRHACQTRSSAPPPPALPGLAACWRACLNASWSPLVAVWLLIFALNHVSLRTADAPNPLPPLSPAALAELRRLQGDSSGPAFVVAPPPPTRESPPPPATRPRAHRLRPGLPASPDPNLTV